jgi:multidrug efflux pump subunit AcrB
VATAAVQSDLVPVILVVEGEMPGVLDQVMLRSASGGLVPVSAVAKVTETREPPVIFREGQIPWVGVRVAGELDALQDVLERLPVPAGVRRDVREPD